MHILKGLLHLLSNQDFQPLYAYRASFSGSSSALFQIIIISHTKERRDCVFISPGPYWWPSPPNPLRKLNILSLKYSIVKVQIPIWKSLTRSLTPIEEFVSEILLQNIIWMICILNICILAKHQSTTLPALIKISLKRMRGCCYSSLLLLEECWSMKPNITTSLSFILLTCS